MKDYNPFLQPGQWYKGALHLHTTRSDGRLSPAESVRFHREHGYHFMAATDHGVITSLEPFASNGFMTIPSVETSYGHNELGQSYHLVVIGVRESVRVPPGQRIQEAIDMWAQVAGLIFLAHPYWSGTTWPEMLPLERLAGMEIFNTSSQTDLGKGLATVHWDDLLVRGKRWHGFAVDDTHGVNDDADGGWVWVKSEALTEKAILGALDRGSFYSSSGPQIHDFRLEDGVARVSCSPVATVNFIGHTQWGSQNRAGPGQAITEAEYCLKGSEAYVRVECTDAGGHAAWSNPIFV